MPILIRPCAPDDHDALRALLAGGDLALQFDKFQGPGGLEHKLADPVLHRDALLLAIADGAPAGFAVAWRMPQGAGLWAMMRVGVAPGLRRRGVGTALVREALARLDAGAAREGLPIEVSGSAWMPNDAAEALAARMGFAHERWFWLMERPRGDAAPAPAWPAGVVTRTFDGGAAMGVEWMRIYNESFAGHFRFSAADDEDARFLAADPTFRPDGLLLAYRDGACIGFCRCVLHAGRGEIGTLGVAPAARGEGLGRALLRWGAAWIESACDLPVTLIVDGDNEHALELYRDEGFAVTRTRHVWQRGRATA